MRGCRWSARSRQQFDVLALDAFTSDAIPVHLLTLEAVEVYRRHLKPDGVLAVHISNRFLDLRPVVLAVAEKCHMNALVVDDPNESDEHYLSTSVWVLLTDDQEFLLEPGVAAGRRARSPRPGASGPTTTRTSCGSCGGPTGGTTCGPSGGAATDRCAGVLSRGRRRGFCRNSDFP